MRTMLIKGFAKHGLKPADITDLLLTHAHHDHCVNWTLFPKARIVIGADELAWALKEPWGETPVPELYVRELQQWPTVHKAERRRGSVSRHHRASRARPHPGPSDLRAARS